MALIKCQECGKEISDSAVTCPHCGYKTSYAKKVDEAKLIVRFSLVLTLICIALEITGGILCFLNGRDLLDYGESPACILGIVLLVIGIIGSLMIKKAFGDQNLISEITAVLHPRPVNSSHSSSSVPTSEQSTGDQKEKKVVTRQTDNDRYWICPNCGKKNLISQTACWSCDYISDSDTSRP